MSSVKETVLEINLQHLTHNYKVLRNKLQKNTKFLAVVKASGYGSDAVCIAKHLEHLGVDYLAVAYVPEGIALRKAGIQTPILVLHPQLANFKVLIEHCLEPNLYSERTLLEFIQIATQLQQTAYPVHIKFNTGLNRLGFAAHQVKTVAVHVSASPSIRVQGLLSHLAASEDLTEREFTLQQISKFETIVPQLTSHLGYPPILHLCNTSGILNYPKAHYDMVRSGIGLYGFGNDSKYDAALRPIATLKSMISQIHTIAPGETLGYNRGFTAIKTTKTATIPIGHADGIGRHYGNGKGFVTLHGQRAYIIGNVCMDMIMVDVTEIDCHEGDEVIIFGESPSAATLAECAGTISYELITSISARVKRKIIKSL